MDEDLELGAEQAYIDHAYHCLDVMREHAARLLEEQDGESFDAEALRWHLRERVSSLGESAAALTFGRIDPEVGERHYIGRRHVRDVKGDAVVVDWRARAAAPFYRATIHDPLGLDRRRRFVLEGKTLVDIFDEHLSDPDSMVAGGGGGVPDPLLAELNRARTGQMRDIVATIQSEQDRIIRAGIDEFIIVQGGPGTGKTAVGLHRAAFLLYEHRELLERHKVLVVGPNRLFLEYIAEVLPSLGETATYQTTVEGLAGGLKRAQATDSPESARLKGDERMADVVRRACWGQLTPASSDLRAVAGGVVLRLPSAELNRMQRTHSENAPNYRDGRDRFLAAASRYLLTENEPDLTASGADATQLVEAVMRSGDVARALNKMWPSTGAAAIVRRLLTSPTAAARAADGSLDEKELRLLRSRSARQIKEEGWSRADLVLIDEAEAILGGSSSRFGHTIVDEAQDLSVMEFRMIGRRTRGGSVTILGDLAQATRAAGQTSWTDVLEWMGRPAGASVVELSLGYRVPAPLLDFANRLLPEAAPGVTPSRSVRVAGDPPRIVRSDAGFLFQDVEDEVRELGKVWQSVGLICPEDLFDDLAASLDATDIRYGTLERGGLGQVVTLLQPAASKGLEFDATVIVEPAKIMEEVQGARRLYVSLTRAVQQLTIVHEGPLPPALAEVAEPVPA